MSQNKHKFSYAFAISACLLLKTTASYGSSSLSNADQDMFEIAAPHHSTMKLTAHTPLGQFFSGSATYIGQNEAGDYIALTNAHCVQFWHRATKCLASFSIDHVTEEGTQQFRITDIEFHPEWFPSQKSSNYDIVKLKLDRDSLPNDSLATPVNYGLTTRAMEAPTLTDFDESILGPEPKLPPEYDKIKDSSKLEDLNSKDQILEKHLSDLTQYDLRRKSALDEYTLHLNETVNQYAASLHPFDGQSFVSVGYGTDGPCRLTHFAKNDQKKRATSTRLLMNIPDQNGVFRLISSQPLGLEYNNETGSYDETNQNEYGARYGMSGGGLYRFIGNNKEPGYELIGMNKSHSHISTSRVYYDIQRTKSYYQNYLGKYIAAAGIPTPFINPIKGQTSIFISLSPIKDWINAPVIANKQTAAQYLYSWIPGKTTSAVLTASASVIGYAAWSYFG